ncbi:TPA: HpaII family restriction endonuclease [Photobacterium damselae]
MLKSDLSRTANAGEWAEFYVLMKILSEGKLYSADGEQNKINDKYFPVISIEMQKSGSSKNEPTLIKYVVDMSEHEIEVISNNNSSRIDMNYLKEEAQKFFSLISHRKGSFSIPEISDVLSSLNNPITKQSSSKKADIHIIIHDIMTGFENEVGFSIKSQHSSPATLINASGQTLFKYKINRNNIDLNIIKELLSPECDNNKVGPKKRVSNLIQSGVDLQFIDVKKNEFRENLQLIDSTMDVFLADCLFVFMTTNHTDLKTIVTQVAQRNPCNYKTKNQERLLDFYTYKMKRLITDAALGMQPSVPWTGQYDASGGYIIVKSTGDVICYHLYNWNALQDYLFNNLRFETPSSTGTGSKSSFNYALYYEDNNESYLDICLQIRFK